MSTPIPVPPTPPLSGHARDLVYGIWSWVSVAVFLMGIGWAVFGKLPLWLIAVSVVINGFGSLTGFLAKNNIQPEQSASA